MQIADIYMSQRKLRRVGQLPGMREALEKFGGLGPKEP